MQVNDMAQKCYDGSAAKGWHDPDMDAKRTPLEFHMLVVSEVAEATEAVRNGWPAVCVDNPDPEAGPRMVAITPLLLSSMYPSLLAEHKPEGEATELADAVIRIMDYFVMMGWDMEAVMNAKLAFNATRSHRHGGKAL